MYKIFWNCSANFTSACITSLAAIIATPYLSCVCHETKRQEMDNNVSLALILSSSNCGGLSKSYTYL